MQVQGWKADKILEKVRLTEPAEDLSGTNAAYLPQICEAKHVEDKWCPECGTL